MEYLAVIPARGGSKGIPRKNLRLLRGKSLIAWTIAAALAAARLGRVVVSTDDDEIAAVSRKAGAEVPFRRPSEIAQDATSTEAVLLHALDALAPAYVPDAVVLLQPTSPMRRAGAVDRAIEAFESSRADSLVSVCENHHFFWRNRQAPQALYDYGNRPRRQDIAPDQRWYRENGSIYITRTATLRRERNRLGGSIVMHVMDEAEGWEVDSELDLRIVEAIMSGAATP